MEGEVEGEVVFPFTKEIPEVTELVMGMPSRGHSAGRGACPKRVSELVKEQAIKSGFC